jgi:hypothetical protein
MLRQRDIIAVHQFIYYQFTYFIRRQGAIRERDVGTVHITYGTYNNVKYIQ